MANNFCQNLKENFSTLKSLKAEFDSELKKSSKEYDRSRLKDLREKIKDLLSAFVILRLGEAKDVGEAADKLYEITKVFREQSMRLDSYMQAVEMFKGQGGKKEVEAFLNRISDEDLLLMVKRIKEAGNTLRLFIVYAEKVIDKFNIQPDDDLILKLDYEILSTASNVFGNFDKQKDNPIKVAVEAIAAKNVDKILSGVAPKILASFNGIRKAYDDIFYMAQNAAGRWTPTKK